MIWSRTGKIADLPPNALPVTTIVILTGGVVSQESGVDTFRD
jgi:NAD-dependent SIR2 family protein deacetylase